MTSPCLRRPGVVLAAALLVSAVFAIGCGERKTPKGKNLLVNSSFEKVANGVPEGWQVHPFRGLDTDIPASWGIDEEHAYDGDKSFYFEALPETRRFFVLTQSIYVRDVDRLRVRGAVKTLDVRRGPNQYPQANFALTCYDKKGNRFESTRYFDLKTPARIGTSGEWILENQTFRIPDNTVRVDFHCAVGMEGKVWFDAISVEVAETLPWLTQDSKNFTFHWLAGGEYPEGAREYQQQLFDNYCTRLGIPEVDRPKINAYLYPDSQTLYDAIGERTTRKSYWDEAEIHSIYPVDDHEIIHIITKPYGVLPLALGEGTAFYLIGDYKGKPVLKVAQDVLNQGYLPSLVSIVDPGLMNRISPDLVGPAAASFVGYLLEMFGPDKFLDLHRKANAAVTPAEFKTAFDAVYGVPVEKAEAEWRRLLAKLDFSRLGTPDSSGTDTTGAKKRR